MHTGLGLSRAGNSHGLTYTSCTKSAPLLGCLLFPSTNGFRTIGTTILPLPCECRSTTTQPATSPSLPQSLPHVTAILTPKTEALLSCWYLPMMMEHIPRSVRTVILHLDSEWARAVIRIHTPKFVNGFHRAPGTPSCIREISPRHAGQSLNSQARFSSGNRLSGE